MAVSAAMLTRQYFAFLVPAFVAAVALGYHADRGRALFRTLLALAALIPFVALVWLWQGLSRQNFQRELYLQGRVRFDPHALSLSLAIPAVYLLPLIVWRIAGAIRWTSAVIGIAAAIPVLAFPVEASVVQTAQGRLTVGFVHRLLVAVLRGKHGTARVLRDGNRMADGGDHRRARCCGSWLLTPPTTQELVPLALVIAFLTLMPFSYMPWEKCAVPLFIPAAALLQAGVRSHVYGTTTEI